MTYEQADYLRIPLFDGDFGVVQVFETAPTRPDCLFIGISTRKCKAADAIAPFVMSEVTALAFCHDGLVTSGQWTKAGFDQIPQFRTVFDYDSAARDDFPDHPIREAAIIEAFVNAIHGLYQWDSFGALFDQIKRPDMDRPTAARLEADA